MQNVHHLELIQEDEEVEILCDYHGNFISLNASTVNLLNSHLLRFVEIKKELGLR